MMLPRVGDQYPTPTVGPHAHHDARIIEIDTHGEPSWEDRPTMPPTIRIRCSCGTEWVDDLIEACENLPPVRRSVA